MASSVKALVVVASLAGVVATSSAAEQASPFPRGWIVFTGDAERGVFCCYLFKIRTDGSGLRRLSGGRVDHDSHLAFAPNGKRVAYASATKSGRGLFAVNLDGNGRGRLTTGPDTNPAYSPDGRRIAFLRDGDLYVMTANGHEERRLRRGFVLQGRPSWTPDGRSIVFSGSDHDLSVLVLYTVDSRSGRIKRRRILQRIGAEDCCLGDALLSPDGRTFLFTGERPTCGECDPATAIYREPYPRGRARRVCEDCAAESWSGDSRVFAWGGQTVIHLRALRDGRTRSVPVGGNVYAEFVALQPR